ncbi:hypothetical protein ABZ801_35525 [Actinomadura sp. NPDC047616]|uniref:hypothetical protein n=1 Tax=Actinomadura sp. NPDC047616 TaxID=3155914 RepID=UPI003411E779
MTAEGALDPGLLLQRLAADPWGFLGRVLQQALDQMGEETSVGHGERPPEDLMAMVLGTWLTRLVDAGEDEPHPDEELRARNDALAAALGACGCWGTRAHCPLCGGAGEPGWALPDRSLFACYVHPALRTVARHRAVAAETALPMDDRRDNERDNERKGNAGD